MNFTDDDVTRTVDALEYHFDGCDFDENEKNHDIAQKIAPLKAKADMADEFARTIRLFLYTYNNDRTIAADGIIVKMRDDLASYNAITGDAK